MQIPGFSILAAILLLTGCSRSPVMTVINRSPVELANVTISGSGYSEQIESLASGAEHRLTVQPRGESAVRVAFDVGERHVDAGEQGYFEANGNYRVTVTVQPDLKVSVSSDLQGY